MVITAEEIAAINETKTEAEKKREAGVSIRNRLGKISRIVEANVEGELELLKSDSDWYKKWLDRCPVAEAE